ncbi:hypothetical protein NQ315_002642 [Exocentrus adspersus]|uniref:Integrase catalytic domain-containing protein n=1 Tax=Exocentrus adspersus TaxID=1586481 RepID=A0AAV8VHX8_9CUCU|nr:hypothetical protein NQ315_013871 [Exocentrus adspersus]KAJ8917947.1 hypothetical protein NQ315_002642 [Exocentrus adspersus]
MSNNGDVKKNVAEELHKSARKNFKRRRTIIKGFGDLWQIDLAEMQPYAKSNRGHRYILVVIDCYSKYVWTRAVKNKTASEVAKAMRGILNDANYAPRNCQSDQGLEFYNKSFKALMDQYGINHYSTYSTKKAAIVERVIKTIKNWLYKEFSSLGRYEWLSILPTITDQYNRRIHSTTKMRPIDVRPDTLIDAYNNPKIAPKKFKFKVGDVVRVSKYKGVFSRGFTPNWSNELFKIAKANITNPATYLLEDMEAKPILGCFYEYELQKTKYPDVYLIEKILRRSGNRVYVRWLGLPDSHNSWVNKADIIKT